MRYDYDIVVIGGGAGGLVCASAAAELGAKTALIEKNRLGGDCTWYGCVPSKTLLRSSQIFNAIKNIGDFGITGIDISNLGAQNVFLHIRNVVERINQHHLPEGLQRKGIKVIFGKPRFNTKRTIEVNGQKINAKRFIICTGSRPFIPPIDGLNGVAFYTNEDIFYLDRIPSSMAILGGGPIGVELAQAFSRLGTKIYLIEMLDRILIKEDAEISSILSDILGSEGVKLLLKRKAIRFSKTGDSISITLQEPSGNLSTLQVEKVLVAVGRTPNIEGLCLDSAGVIFTKQGIRVDDMLRTSSKNIYACGDVVGPYQFSHMAEYQAVIALGNALFPFKKRVDYRAVPWCTFTDPEVAHLGLTEEEARQSYSRIRIAKYDFSQNDRAITDSKDKGMIKVIWDRRGNILGAHIIGPNAGEIIHEFVLAKTNNLTIGKISKTIHIYPTLSQAIKRCADDYYLDILNSKWFRLFTRFAIGKLQR